MSIPDLFIWKEGNSQRNDKQQNEHRDTCRYGPLKLLHPLKR
jgi:hypothetical protein